MSNVRIGVLSAEVGRHVGTVIRPALSPHEEARTQAREMVGNNFSEQRDAKGMYALARAGKIKGLASVDDTYVTGHRRQGANGRSHARDL